MIPPPDDSIPDLPAEQPSLLSRAGEQAVNLGPNILNDMLRLSYNVGLSPTKEEVPQPYDIPEARTVPEAGVDVAASLASALPFFATGEGAGEGLAELTKAGPILSRIMRTSAGFGLQGATESPQEAGVGAGLGAGFGAAEAALPLPARLAAAGLVGLGTYASEREQGVSPTGSAILGTTQALLPFLTRGRVKDLPKPTESDIPLLTYRPPEQRYLEDVQTARVIPGTGGPIPYGGELEESTSAARPIFGTDTATGRPIFAKNTELQPTPPPPFPLQIGGRTVPPEGSLIREPIMTQAESRVGAGIRPPEGSLVEQPTFTSGEVAAGMGRSLNGEAEPGPATAKPARILQSTVLDHNNPDQLKAIASKVGLEFGTPGTGIWPAEFSENGIPRIEFKIPENADNAAAGSNLGVPSGTKVKDLKNLVQQKIADFEAAEAKHAEFVQQNKVQPKVATLQPEVQTPNGPTTGGGGTGTQLAVRYKGEVFQGATHEEAIEKMAEKYPGYKSESRRAFPIERGEVTPAGNFQTVNLLEKARAARQAEAAKARGEQEVATLQPAGAEPQSSISESRSSLETKPATIRQVELPQGLSVGDKAVGTVDGEPVIGTIHPTVEPDTVRLVTSKGEPHDLSPSSIRRLGEQVTVKPPVESVGGAAEAEQAGEAAPQGKLKLKGGGFKRTSTFGEYGFVDPQVISVLTRYGVMPAVGAAVGYQEDEQHRVGSAVIGALAGGLLGHFGGKYLKLFLERHPDVQPGSGKLAAETAKAVGDDLRETLKSVLGSDAKAREAAKGIPDGFGKLATWIKNNFHFDLDKTRIFEKAYGTANFLSKGISDSLWQLRNIPAINSYKEDIGRYFRGDITFDQFKAIAPKQIADLAATITKSRDELQNIIVDGLGKSAIATKIKDSIGSYMTRSYKIFTDAKYLPTDAQIEFAARSLRSKFPGENLDQIMEHINEYLHEIKANRGLFNGFIHQGESLSRISQRLNKDLTPEFRAMLGEFDDPLIEMGYTGQKLVNGAKAAGYFNEIANGEKANGLKFAYSTEERQAMIATLQHESKYNFTPELRAAAADKLQQLKDYVYNDSGIATGRLSQKWMDGNLRQQLSAYTEGTNRWQYPLGMAAAKITNDIKYGKLLFSPLQVARNVIQLPLLGLMAKTFPDDWMRSAKVLFDKSPEGLKERERLERLGLFTGDPVGGMLRRDVTHMVSGTYDSMLANKMQRGLHTWEELWRTPDQIVRVAKFLKEEKNLLDQGVAPDVAARKATDLMNRYTINYAGVPSAVKVGRQLPFVNVYLSWSYETLRIAKNLVEDAKNPASGNQAYAIGALATMATAPLLIEKMAEAQLSKDDKDEWDKVKDLGPAYTRGNFRFVIGRQLDGTFRYIDFTPLVIHDQLMRMVRGVMAGDKDEVAASNPVVGWENTPLLNVASILTTGRDRFTGEQLQTNADEFNALRKEVAPTLLGTELDRIVKALTPNNMGGLGITDTRSGRQNNITDILMSYLTSTRAYTLKPDYLKYQATADTRNQIQALQATAKQILRTNASDAVKERAKAQYQENLKQVLQDYQQKMGIPLSQAPSESAPQ